ncbi:MAG: carbohydrate ABC transporter permease [Spirochaetaceae bacterium]|nr:carbohydrate ABC transporter permease [Spirochaetaceae bacterium]
MKKSKVKITTADKVWQVFIVTLLLCVSVIVLVPILNLIALSLSDPARVSEVRGLTIFPKGFSLVNYRVLAANPLFMRSILNSVFITVVGTALNLLVTSMAAFALSRPKLPFKRFFMTIIIIVMILEPGLVPEYLVVKGIGLMNSQWSVILYKLVNVYYLIILMRFFEDIPESFIEAAQVDGASYGTILAKVILPLSKSALATQSLFYGVYHWNEYFRSSIYLSDPNKYPLQLILRQFVVLDDTASLIGSGSLFSYDEAARLNYDALQASTIIVAILPVLIIYPLILKYYARGSMEGGIKE